MCPLCVGGLRQLFSENYQVHMEFVPKELHRKFSTFPQNFIMQPVPHMPTYP